MFYTHNFHVLGVVYRIEAKEVKARMDTQMVRKVLDMGYSSSTVRRVIEERLRTTGIYSVSCYFNKCMPSSFCVSCYIC